MLATLNGVSLHRRHDGMSHAFSCLPHPPYLIPCMFHAINKHGKYVCSVMFVCSYILLLLLLVFTAGSFDPLHSCVQPQLSSEDIQGAQTAGCLQ